MLSEPILSYLRRDNHRTSRAIYFVPNGNFVVQTFVLVCLGIFLALGTAQAKTFTRVGDILALTPEEAAKSHPVEITGRVLFLDYRTMVCFIHDGEKSIYISYLDRSFEKEGLAAGNSVILKGVTTSGDFLPTILYKSLVITGNPGLPPARPVTQREMMEPAVDCQWIEFEAVMKSYYVYSQYAVVDFEVAGRTVGGSFPSQLGINKPPEHLLERPLRVRCVAVAQFNEQRQMCGRSIYIPSLESLTPETPAVDTKDARLLRCDELLSPYSSLGELVRVRGTVTHLIPGTGFWIYGNDTGLFIQAAAPDGLKVGEEVEAWGFATFAPFRPKMNAIRILRTGKEYQAPIIPLDVTKKPSGPLHGSLVTLEAEFLGRGSRSEFDSILCTAGERTFEAVTSSRDIRVDEIEPGTKLKLTGIYGLKSTHPMSLAKLAEGFQIQLRSAADMSILSHPPWWKSRRVIWVTGMVLGIAALTGLWAVLLKSQVRKQASVIALQTVSQATLEERHRIARDLHDTLEQDLMGVSMLLDNTAAKLSTSPASATSLLEIARRLLRRSRAESRSTICDLRSVTLEQLGLPAAIREVLQPLAEAAGMKLKCNFPESWPPIPRHLESAIFRVAREAASNAARHSGGKTIEVTLSRDGDSARVTIADDGKGFEPTLLPSHEAQFGLRGMEERVNAIQGQLIVNSALDQGTQITMILNTKHKLHD